MSDFVMPGNFRVCTDGTVVTARGIQYATAARFELPKPVHQIGETDARAHGPLCPQGPARIEAMAGKIVPDDVTFSEDCLTLSVTASATPGPKPVIVWIHGGSYETGGGSLPVYAPDRIVTEGDVVFVAINYRLGVFGFLNEPDFGSANCGLHDQIAALRWVREHIRTFGGDPDNVTLLGQSAGADSIRYLLAMEETEGLFRRAILQSAPIGLDALTDRASTSKVVANLFREGSGGRRALVDASPERLLADQTDIIKKLHASAHGWMPFGPSPGCGGVPKAAELSATLARRAPSVDVLIGYTYGELACMALSQSVRAWVKKQTGPLKLVGRSAGAAVPALASLELYAKPTKKLAGALSAAGGNVFLYRFDWSPRSKLRACHMIDVPFVLGDWDVWRHAPMLSGADVNEVETLGRRVRCAWTCFARTGRPDGDADWPPHVTGAGPGKIWK